MFWTLFALCPCLLKPLDPTCNLYFIVDMQIVWYSSCFNTSWQQLNAHCVFPVVSLHVYHSTHVFDLHIISNIWFDCFCFQTTTWNVFLQLNRQICTKYYILYIYNFWKTSVCHLIYSGRTRDSEILHHCKTTRKHFVHPVQDRCLTCVRQTDRQTV